METPRISASSYSNTAPLIWSFLYGRNRSRVEIILDNAPARSAELLGQDRVDAALVPVIVYQTLADVKLIPGVCVGAKEKVRSVCLVTDGRDLNDVRTVSLDVSSRSSVALVKIIFREFLGKDIEYTPAAPNVEEMLAASDAALIIGDPALSISDSGFQISDFESQVSDLHAAVSDESVRSKIQNLRSKMRKFDLAELWKHHTGLGFIFAMWMTRADSIDIDFAAVRDEGVANADSIAASYTANLPLSQPEIRDYLTQSISYTPDESMIQGMALYMQLAHKHDLIKNNKDLIFV
ncbi:MAG: menaquinone biosynthetic enzyme MqnA/MqnD family protein [Pyrinomonadaceae bacterium]